MRKKSKFSGENLEAANKSKTQCVEVRESLENRKFYGDFKSGALEYATGGSNAPFWWRLLSKIYQTTAFFESIPFKVLKGAMISVPYTPQTELALWTKRSKRSGILWRSSFVKGSSWS